MSYERKQIPKAELLTRLNARSFERYGGRTGEAWLNDLLKDGMMDSAKRAKNDGMHPVYLFDATHYRRALQIKRMVSMGIVNRDAQRVQLFIRGYGLKPYEARDSMRNELN